MRITDAVGTESSTERTDMHTQLQGFLRRYLGVVAITLAPVIFTAFVSIPVNLARHPGEVAAVQPQAPMRHMS
jgi:hypothetical protein